ncbi:hypothetical protein FDW84_18820 (plasmid) [Pseudarthrobacter sp. NamE5]|nr:hypothetical protein FDW84_18820 [Pseudarthrobacter sp. NamE5]
MRGLFCDLQRFADLSCAAPASRFEAGLHAEHLQGADVQDGQARVLEECDRLERGFVLGVGDSGIGMFQAIEAEDGGGQ